LEPATVSLPSGEFKLPRLRRRRRRQILLVSLCLLLGFTVWFVPPVYKLKHGPLVVTRIAKSLGETKATVGPGLKGWIATERISRHALHAIVAAEDGRFYEHHGLDFDQIQTSYELNRRKKRYARGASTLSQQVVKMAFLGREKTLVRKAREALGTLLMELILPKDKILEWYINLAEFGDGVYGIQDGCWHYFKTKPELLTIEQSVHLALVLPSPNAWSRGLRSRALTPFGQRRYAAILNTMRGMGFITQTQWLAAVMRADFGRPLSAYAALVAADQSQSALCPGSPNCPESPDDDAAEDEDEITADGGPPAAALPPTSGTDSGTGTASPAAPTAEPTAIDAAEPTAVDAVPPPEAESRSTGEDLP
jgi:monofunctional biosynthetic peptidoglycan transglycosylase